MGGGGGGVPSISQGQLSPIDQILALFWLADSLMHPRSSRPKLLGLIYSFLSNDPFLSGAHKNHNNYLTSEQEVRRAPGVFNEVNDS